MNRKALIAMSGGVDSSVAAALMCEAGYDCIGVTMRLYDGDTQTFPEENGLVRKTCCSLSDSEDARSVARRLGIRYYVFNFTKDFGTRVIDRFVRAYQAGLTPNPCIDCNRYMKFEKLYGRARELGCDMIVTGHYARTAYDPVSGRWQLLKGLNQAKDQSYVLCFMTQAQLAHTCFPLGEMKDKAEVRSIADRYGFVNAGKRDSQDICFVPNGKYADFIESYTGTASADGDFVDTEGNVLGRHKGIIRYTVGQHKRLGLSTEVPLYVCQKCPSQNTVVLTEEAGLYSDRLFAGDFNWISVEAPKAPIRAAVKLRYHAKEADAWAEVLPDGRVKIIFDQPQRAITPGQAVVLYDGEIVLGGGTILSR